MEKSFCPLCGAKSFEKKIKSFFKTYCYKCENCFLFYTDWGRNENFLKNYYKESYWKSRKNSSIRSNIIKKIIREMRANSQFRYINKNKIKVLDFGAGDGTTARFFANKDSQVSVIEPDIENQKKISKNSLDLKILKSTYENLDKKIGKFDVIIMSHVLEHMPHLEKVLMFTKNCLKKDGVLFIEVPNCEEEELLKRSIQQNPHLYHFTKSSLKFCIEKFGYRIEKLDFWSMQQPKKIFVDDIKLFFDYIKKRDIYYKDKDSKSQVIRLLAKHNNNIKINQGMKS